MTMFRLGMLVIATATGGLIVSYAIFDPIWIEGECYLKEKHCPSYVGMTMAVTMSIAGILTLFGTIAVPGSQNPDGSFKEQRIRLSITMSILVIYFIWWSFSLQWTNSDEPLNPMFGTLTDLIKIIIPFYFGASAFAQWSENQSSNRDNNRGD